MRTALPLLTRRGTATTASAVARSLATTSEVFRLRDTFERRHIGPNDAERTEMLASLGFDNLDDLIHSTIPEGILLEKPLSLVSVSVAVRWFARHTAAAAAAAAAAGAAVLLPALSAAAATADTAAAAETYKAATAAAAAATLEYC